MKLRPWQPPAAQLERKPLPRTSAVVAAPGAPGAQADTMIGCEGRWTNWDVTITAPPVWLDVTLEVVAELGTTRWPVQRVALAQLPAINSNEILQNALVAPTRRFSTRVFAIRGVLADRLYVRAFRTDVDHPEAEFAIAPVPYGQIAGDRSNKQTIYPFARPEQLWSTTVEVSNDEGNVGVPVPLQAANPDGGRIALTNLEITTNDTTNHRVELHTTTPVGTRLVRQWRMGAIAGGGGVFYVNTPFTFPERSDANGNFEITVFPIVSGQYEINANGVIE